MKKDIYQSPDFKVVGIRVQRVIATSGEQNFGSYYNPFGEEEIDL